jgi:hypothetical protein
LRAISDRETRQAEMLTSEGVSLSVLKGGAAAVLTSEARRAQRAEMLKSGGESRSVLPC